MLEFVIASQGVVILGLVAVVIRTHERLWRVAMSRTPGEYRAAEKDVQRKPASPKPQTSVEIDEATQLVLEAVTADYPMPHGLGGN